MKKISDTVYNLRCPYCGDSKKSLRKARGYIYFKENKWHYFCHNCGIYKPYPIFLSENRSYRIEDSVLSSEYKNISSNLNFLKKITELKESHPSVQYVKKRMIPEDRWNEIYYCANPLQLKNKFIYNPSIAFINYHFNNPLSIIFRGINDDCKIKHFCFNISEDNKPYNFYKINKERKVYIVEGLIDSLFFENSVALLGLNKLSLAKELLEYNHVLILDNEPHKKETITAYEKAIEMGYNIFIWPKEVSIEIKDVNDFIKAGNTKEDLLKMISKNTYNGLSAKLALTKYKI